MKFQCTDYKKLSGKQQEIYNFQKVAGVSATTLSITSSGPTTGLALIFFVYYKDGIETLKVQLKGA
ncbi:hypothetical protein ACFS3C_27335 [Azotobacter vinelandii]